MVPFDKIQLEEALHAAKIKLRLRRELKFVPQDVEDWEDRDFLAVIDRHRSKGVLIVPYAGGLKAAPFRLDKRLPNKLGRIESVICDICATWQRGTNSASITFQKEGSTVSFLCCGDLLCSLHVRGKTPQAKLSRAHLREDIAAATRIQRLITRLESILEGALA